MRPACVLPLLALVLAACGGSSGTTVACKGLPTAEQTRTPLVLFGEVPKLDKRALCAQFGSPTGFRQLSHGREIWTYDNVSFLLFQGRVDGYTKVSGPSP